MDRSETLRIPAQFGFDAASLEAVDSGLINRTYLVTGPAGDRAILQWVNPLFTTEVNADIDAVTAHLAGHGVLTPRLLRTPGGALDVPGRNGHWRMMTWIDGETVRVAASDAIAREAGRMLGRFHSALADFTHPFRHRRTGVHDTARHLDHLRGTLARRVGHPRHGTVARVGAAILDEAARMPALPPLPERVVHGDPKISNVLFERGTGIALCLVDLDTVGPMALPLELGDALRSWSNSAGEDTRQSAFSPARFQAALEGYAGGAPGLVRAAEAGALVTATRLVYVELAARFCADALNEDYFAWDPGHFASHSEHSEVRAAGQLDAAQAVAAQAPALERFVATLFIGS